MKLEERSLCEQDRCMGSKHCSDFDYSSRSCLPQSICTHRFKSNREKKNFELGAEAVGTIVALGSNASHLKVTPYKIQEHTELLRRAQLTEMQPRKPVIIHRADNT